MTGRVQFLRHRQRHFLHAGKDLRQQRPHRGRIGQFTSPLSGVHEPVLGVQNLLHVVEIEPARRIGLRSQRKGVETFRLFDLAARQVLEMLDQEPEGSNRAELVLGAVAATLEGAAFLEAVDVVAPAAQCRPVHTERLGHRHRGQQSTTGQGGYFRPRRLESFQTRRVLCGPTRHSEKPLISEYFGVLPQANALCRRETEQWCFTHILIHAQDHFRLSP